MSTPAKESQTSAAAESFPIASVTVDHGEPTRAISPSFIGLSYESSVLESPDYLSPDNLSLLGLMRRLGRGAVLRLGGNMSESTVWSETGQLREESFVITPASIDALAGLLEALDWRLIYGLNLARGAPEAAAGEAAYVANAVGSRLLAFQIGNEPDGFGRWRAVRPPDYDCHTFVSEWREFHNAIRARLPDAPFAGPAIAVENAWIRPFIDAAGESLVLVTRHHYGDGPAGAPHVSIEKLLRAAPRVGAMLEKVLSISESTGLPFRIAETNSIFNEGQPGVSDSFASALWGLEYMFQLAEAGACGLNFHTGNLKAYTPIGPSEGGRHTARPLYYGIMMFKEAVRDAVLVSTRSVVQDVNLAAFATRASDGALRVCLINKDLASGGRVNIDVGPDLTSVSALWLTAPSAGATESVTLGDSMLDDFGRWSPRPPQVSALADQSLVEVPAASAVMLQFASG